MTAALVVLAIIVFFVVIFALSAIKVAREYERGIIFRLSRLQMIRARADIAQDRFMQALRPCPHQPFLSAGL